MQSVHSRMNSSLSPPLKKILDPPMMVAFIGVPCVIIVFPIYLFLIF